MSRLTARDDPESELPDYQPNDDIPIESDLIMSDAGGPVHAPPARVVARFSTTRRKSSAASSRRNSISSNHSHHSNRSFRSGCQSAYIAQHLRRASIIESRKARLADRAAHAEQVRRRAAALAKAATRASSSEERSLAAQQAREKYLAQVAAACAEEVKRAKKVAEEMKERKAAEEKRFRLEMEEKHAEAERRRLEYQRNGKRLRATSSPVRLKKVVEEPTLVLDEDEAARRIQRVWRSKYRKNAMDAFSKLGLSIDRVSDMEFETVSTLLKSDVAINTTSRLLAIYSLGDGESRTILNDAVIRKFLTAYVILGHPAAVLSKNGLLEQDLITKARDLLICFEAALLKASPANGFLPPLTHTDALSQVYSPFLAAFDAWKEQDASAMIETMIASFVELDAIWQTVKDDTDGEVAKDYREGIRMNQTVLLSQIKKVAGAEKASVLIKRAIRESRRARAGKKAAGDLRPRPAVESAIENSPDASEHSEKAAQAVAQLGENQKADESSGSLIAEFGKLFSPFPSNRVMVHEVSIDKGYRIKIIDGRDAFNRKLCDEMRKRFELDQGASWTVAMAENIRFRLLRLLHPGNSMHTLISEALDPSFIHSQSIQGVFSYHRFFSFMAAILPKLCAPFRDATVKEVVDQLPQEGADIGEMIDTLFKILHIVDLLSLDYSNFLIAQAAPSILAGAVPYEERAFAADLESGQTTLQKTRHWWRNASVNAITEAHQRDSEGVRHPADRPSFLKIYGRGLVDLAIATVPLTEADVPETLQLDHVRLAEFRADTLRLTTVGALLLTAKNLLKRDTRSPWKPEAARLWDLFRDHGFATNDVSSNNDDDGSGSAPSIQGRVLAILESAHPMPPTTRAQLTTATGRFLAQAASGRPLTDPFLKLLLQRLRTHVRSRVSSDYGGERGRATGDAGFASSTLVEFGPQVGRIVEMLGRIGDVDRRTHRRWYEVIAAEVERGEGEGAGGGR
ncbi:MAG: hypothetical protein M1822_001397 [Bathelium mastoideum]|nr:MAG: hypothetical protein M1822_001397 [Bathelium mastoideum]